MFFLSLTLTLPSRFEFELIEEVYRRHFQQLNYLLMKPLSLARLSGTDVSYSVQGIDNVNA